MNETTQNYAPTMRGEAMAGNVRLRPGDEILGRYVVESELGQGGMGVVYKCLDKVGGVEVAVKGLPPEVSHNADEMEEIRDNYSLVEGLRHPNICGIKTLEKDERGDYYLVMDLARGVNLNRWLRQHPEATEAEKLAILRQIASALDYAHEMKIIHRDVKPENAMVDDAGKVLVLDFGLAAQVRSSLSRTSQAVTSKSGTPGYKAPEQWLGRPQGPASDQYALGVIAYKMFAGFLPFDGDDIVVLGQAVLTAPVEPVNGTSDTVNAALAKALAKKPTDRFFSCAAFVAALEGHAIAAESQQNQPRNERKVPSNAADIYLVEAKAKDLFERKVAHASEPTDTALKDAFGQLRILYSAASNARQCGDSAAARRLYADFTQSVADYETAVAEVARKVEEARQAELVRQREEARKAEEARQAELVRQREEARKAEEARQAELARQCEAEAKRWSGDGAKAGDVQEMTLPGGAKMKFVWCPPGTFTMGSPKGFFKGERGRIDNETQHRVTLTKGFWLGQFEVTQAQWKSVMGNNPSHFTGEGNHPVEKVSWEDCQTFIAMCNEYAKGITFALPTEAQWEYACRAGTTGPYAGTGNLEEMGWYIGNSRRPTHHLGQICHIERTHPIGQKKPNAWNLYDMHGNVSEWCADWYGTYEVDCVDPKGPTLGKVRVVRGGCFYDFPQYCRSAFRGWGAPSRGDYDCGFRLVCSAGPHGK